MDWTDNSCPSGAVSLRINRCKLAYSFGSTPKGNFRSRRQERLHRGREVRLETEGEEEFGEETGKSVLEDEKGQGGWHTERREKEETGNVAGPGVLSIKLRRHK